MPKKLTAELLNAAIEGFEAQKRRIDAQIAEIREMLKDTRTEPVAVSEPSNRKRTLSAAARKRIGEAQRKRWAESKSQSELSQPAVSEAPKPKRKLSAAGRKRMIEATKRRWAAFHAARGAEKAAAKKAVVKRGVATKGPVKMAKRAAKAPKARVATAKAE
jgi:hypothetical protein